MKQVLTLLAACVAGFGGADSARGLTVVATFDSSITGDANGAAMMGAINAAITNLEANIADSFSVYINFVSDPTVGLGENNTWINNYSYHEYMTALRAGATDANDERALSQLPNHSVDPVVGSADLVLTLPLARHLGMDSGEGPDGFDSTIYFNMTLMNVARPPTNRNDFDLEAVALHEMDEVLGTSSGLPDGTTINAADLFRYTTNLQRTYTTSGDNAYFSVDGTNLWARYSQDANGDYGDWWSFTGHWAPPGKPAVQQVQDAFAYPDTIVNLGTNELTLLDVVGWTLTAGSPPKAPTLLVAAGGAGKITIYWPVDFGGYRLQENTALGPAGWANSATGTANPATIAIGSGAKFYRLSAAIPFPAPGPLLVRASDRSTLRLSRHGLRPRN